LSSGYVLGTSSHIILQHHSQLDSDQSVADYHLDHYYESSYKIALFTSSSSFRFRTRYMCTLHSCVTCALVHGLLFSIRTLKMKPDSGP